MLSEISEIQLFVYFLLQKLLYNEIIVSARTKITAGFRQNWRNQMKNTIGENIAYFRKKKAMTQEELSEKMHVTAQAVSKWENDLSYPDLESIGRLARILDTTADSLIEGAEQAPSVKVAETENIERRIFAISVQTKDESKTSVHLRIPMELVLQADVEGGLADLVGEEAAGYMKKMLELIKKGLVGPVVDVQSEGADVKIEVVDYEN